MSTQYIQDYHELVEAVNRATTLQKEIESDPFSLEQRILRLVRTVFACFTCGSQSGQLPTHEIISAKKFVDLTHAIDQYVGGRCLEEYEPAGVEANAQDMILMLEIRRLRHFRDTMIAPDYVGSLSCSEGVDRLIDQRILQDDRKIRELLSRSTLTSREGVSGDAYPVYLGDDLFTVLKEFRRAFWANPDAIRLLDELLKNAEVESFQLLEKRGSLVRYRLELKKSLSASKLLGLVKARISRVMEISFIEGRRIELTEGSITIKVPIVGSRSYNVVEYLAENEAPDPERLRRLMIVGYKAHSVDGWLNLLRKHGIVLR